MGSPNAIRINMAKFTNHVHLKPLQYHPVTKMLITQSIWPKRNNPNTIPCCVRMRL